MTDDLIARLRWMAGKPRPGDPHRATAPNLLDAEREALLQAADEIESCLRTNAMVTKEAYEARQEIKRLREAIRWGVEIYGMPESEHTLREALQ